MLGWLRGAFGFLSQTNSIVKTLEGVRALCTKVFSVLPGTRRGHAKVIRKMAGAMPFIYNDDLALEVASDYIRTRLAPLNRKTLKFHDAVSNEPDTLGFFQFEENEENDPEETADRPSGDESLLARLIIKRNRRGLILGPAGIGKSTFMRRATLERAMKLDPSHTDDLFAETPGLVPFFVPLKVAVESDRSLPILTYILRLYPYIGGPFGLRRLVALARKRQVFLALDGYDEVLFGEQYGKDLREEIDAIFARDCPLGLTNKLQEDFYFYLKDCPVWLSSRKDFYANHRLLVDRKYAIASNDEDVVRHAFLQPALTWKGAHFDAILPTVEIIGIENKAALVERILDRYKGEAPDVYGDRTVPGFFEWVESQYDENTNRLQSNPLFLTVMCYLYANASRVATAGRVAEERKHSLRELVGNCVSLLIRDLDRYRIRKLKGGFYGIRSRLAHPDEKLAFLRYFAARLFYDERLSATSLFSREDIYREAVQFGVNERWPEEVCKPLRSRKPANLVEQLILQGLFIIVDRNSPSGVLLDLPHQRFREVLAVEYLDTEEGLRFALEKLGDRNFGELLKVFFTLTTQYRDVLLERVLDQIRAPREEHFVRLAVSFLDDKPLQYDPRRTLKRWIEQAVEEGRMSDIAPALARHCELDAALTELISRKTISAATSGDETRSIRCATILFRLSPGSFDTLASEMCQRENSAVRRAAYAMMAQLHPDLFFKELQLSSPELRDEMSRYAAALHTHSTRLWRFAVEILDPTDLATITELATQPALLDCIRRAQARLETLRAFIGYLDQQLPDFAVHYNDPTREDELLRIERRESNSPLTTGGFGAYRLTVVDDLLQQLPAAGVPVWCNDNRLISRLLGGREGNAFVLEPTGIRKTRAANAQFA